MKNINNDKPQSYNELSGRQKIICDDFLKLDLNNKKILNIGCGFGWFELFISSNNKTCKITGIEPDEANLITAKKHLMRENITLETGDACNLIFESNEYDYCLSTEVIEHIPINCEQKFMDEAYRVLKQNGLFLITTPLDTFWGKYTDPAYYLSGHRHYSVEELRRYAINSGFEIIESSKRGGIAALAAITDLYISKWILRRKPLFHEFLKEYENKEYSRDGGFMTVFLLLRKN